MWFRRIRLPQPRLISSLYKKQLLYTKSNTSLVLRVQSTKFCTSKFKVKEEDHSMTMTEATNGYPVVTFKALNQTRCKVN